MATATLEKVETTTETKPGKVYTYYGLEYNVSVKEMAAKTELSVRTVKTFLELKAMGYEAQIQAGWTATQCYAHAGRPKRKPAPRKASIDEYKALIADYHAVILGYREKMADAEYEITRLRGMVIELGGDLDKF